MALPSVFDEIDRLFDELIHQPWGGARRAVVLTEIRETEGGWIVEMPSEGMRAEEVTVAVHGRRLTVTGTRQREQQRAQGRGWTRTRQEVGFERTVTLPAEADADKIEATIEGSRLHLRVPRRRP